MDINTKLWTYLNNIFVILRFVLNSAGREYGISKLRKLKLAKKIIQNSKVTGVMSGWPQHILLVQEIFRISKSLKGDVVECGSAAGGSAVSLSLACALTNRRFFVCDSFEGLPEPKEDEIHEVHNESLIHYVWEKGEFAFSLESVMENIRKHGNIEVCMFVKGFFEDSLKDIQTDSIVMVFEDADMPSSVQDCLRYLWPKLQDGCKFFSHEPWSIGVVSLFYDDEWWMENLGTTAPGFYGSGQGVLVGFNFASIGFTRKFDPERVKEHGGKILHVGSRGYEGEVVSRTEFEI